MTSKTIKKTADMETLKSLPEIKIWGNKLSDIYNIKLYKGKFVVTGDGKFIAKILPKSEYDNAKIFHNNMLLDLGIKNPDSAEMKRMVTGGGKIEVEMVGDYTECRLYGESQTYGPYDKNDINIAEMESALEATFHLGMMPILVIPDFENMT
jgi:hypothetical protein